MSWTPIHPGKVELSADNPGMYLKDSPEGPFLTLISFFRAVWSPHGRGHAAFMLQDPNGTGTGGSPNVCVTDNEPLARYIKDNFLCHFGPFRNLPALPALRFERGGGFTASWDLQTRRYTERFHGERGETVLIWHPLDDVFFIEVPKEKSVTGQHQLFGTVINASGAQASIDGRGAAGRAFPRDFLGKSSSTAFVAFRETWVRP